MKLPEFLICAPVQSTDKSNGVHALVHLAKTIEKLGRTAQLCQIVSDDHDLVCKVDLNTVVPADAATKTFVDSILQVAKRFGVKMFGDFTRERIDASYVVYPESVLGNPLGAKNVVRYFLNRDGILKNGRMVALGAGDFILAHSKVIRPDAQHVCFFSLANPLFNRENTDSPAHRRLDLTYVGKGALDGFGGKIDGTVTITRNDPATKEELAVLLRHCRFFYTADACSNLNYEALRCGAIPVLMHNGPWTDADLDSFEPGVLPRVTLGTVMDENALREFELVRERYLEGVHECERSWEPSVAGFIGKVDRHFAAQDHASQSSRSRGTKPRGAIRTERSAANSLGFWRKERKRWMANPSRPGQ